MNTFQKPLTAQEKKKKKKRRILHTFFRILLILFVVGIVINTGIILFTVIRHKKKLRAEEDLLANPPGRVISVNGHDIYAWDGGNPDAEHTIVFLHNNGSADSSVALQPLFEELDKDYRLIYADRTGNGRSPSVKGSGELDTQLSDMKGVLERFEVKGPVVLCGIGSGGLLADYWAAKEPSNVEAVIGIGAFTPDDFEGMTRDDYCTFKKWLLVRFVSLGFHRYTKSIYPENIGNVYTERQMQERKALISKGYYTKGSYKEDFWMVDNANKVAETGFPEKVPVLELLGNVTFPEYLAADEQVKKELDDATKGNADVKLEDLSAEINKDRFAYYKQFSNVKTVEMAGPIEIYVFNPKGVAKEIGDFLQGISK